MSAKPTQYSDLGKKSKDLLTEKYTEDAKVEVKTSTLGPAVTATLVRKADGSLKGDVEAKQSVRGVAYKAKHETDSHKTKIDATYEGEPIAAGKLQLEAVFKAQALDSAKATYSYAHGLVAAKTSVDLVKKLVASSVVVASNGVSAGLDLSYDVNKAKASTPDAVLGYAAGDVVVNATATKAFSVFGVNYYHNIEKLVNNKTVIGGEFAFNTSSQDKTFTVGTATKFAAYDSELRLKATQAGQIDAVVVAKVHDKVTLSIGAKANVKNSAAAPTVAVAFALAH